MRTIVRCAILAPTLALGLPAGLAEDKPEQTSTPATPPKNELSHGTVTDLTPPAKSIPPFLTRPKPPAPTPPAHAVVPASSAAEEIARKSPANPEVSSSIRHSFPYVPSTEPAVDETQADPTLPVIEMKPFHVATGRIVERVTKGMEERRQKELEKAFNVKDGGWFGKIGPAEIGLKFDPKHKGWDILSIPW